VESWGVPVEVQDADNRGTLINILDEAEIPEADLPMYLVSHEGATLVHTINELTELLIRQHRDLGNRLTNSEFVKIKADMGLPTAPMLQIPDDESIPDA
jgi:hypothetical protein